MWKIEYYYDQNYVGDLFELTTNGFSFSTQRNTVGQTTFTVSLRHLAEWCASKSFDVKSFFTPMRSTVKIVQIVETSPTEISGVSVGGWLSSRPGFTFGAQADTTVQLTFTGWLGLCAGAFVLPPLSYNDNFDDVIKSQIEEISERTFLAGRRWPISYSHADNLAVVSAVLEAPKTLKDFMLERADNTTGTGVYDVYVDYDGRISLYEKYGTDISASTQFTYPDVGDGYGLKEISYSEWGNYISDIFLTGAGNGYASTSGAEGAAIFSTARNATTISNMGYWQHATSESDISSQTVLDDKATSYVRNTDLPFDIPTLKIDGDSFRLYDHSQGGTLWLGDTVSVDLAGWVEPLLPITSPTDLRVDRLEVAVDQLGHAEVSLGMVTDD